MGLFARMLGRKPEKPEPASEEHAVIVHLALSLEDLGKSDDLLAVFALSDRLEQALRAVGVGELDGNEFGGRGCTLYMYGPDADRLFAAVERELRRSPVIRGGHAIKRYGAATNPAARVTRIPLDYEEAHLS